MKKVALAVAMALALGGTAKADLFDYAELFGGGTMEPELSTSGFEGDMQTGYNVGAALGWKLAPEFALEIEGFYTASNFEGPLITQSSLETFTFMANAFWTFDGGGWSPYIGAGLGGAQINVTDGNFNFFGTTPFQGDADVVFAWQAMGGFTVPVAEGIDMLAEYRFQSAEDADLTLIANGGGTLPIQQEYKSHNVSIGFRFNM
jgi:OOP family OmpA-OmpF porin